MDKSSAVRVHSGVNRFMGVTTDTSKDQDFAEIQAAVVDAFDEICRTEPQLINRFHQAFNERGATPELEESRGCDGMRAVISSILWKVVPEKYLDRQPLDGTVKVDNHFIGCLRTAISELAEVHPYILRDLKRYQERTGRKYLTILGAQIAFEIDNKRACPY